MVSLFSPDFKWQKRQNHPAMMFFSAYFEDAQWKLDSDQGHRHRRSRGKGTWHYSHAPEAKWGRYHTNFQELAGYHLLVFQHEYRLIGHTGLGGQNLRWDEENKLVIAFLSNGLKVRLRFVVTAFGMESTASLQGGLGDRARTYVRLVEAIYDCLPRAKRIMEGPRSSHLDPSRMISARESIKTWRLAFARAKLTCLPHKFYTNIRL